MNTQPLKIKELKALCPCGLRATVTARRTYAKHRAPAHIRAYSKPCVHSSTLVSDEAIVEAATWELEAAARTNAGYKRYIESLKAQAARAFELVKETEERIQVIEARARELETALPTLTHMHAK
jgi:hypothetical protein